MLIELPNKNFCSTLSEKYQDRIAIDSSRGEKSFAKFNKETDWLAANLLSKDVTENNRVILIINSPERLFQCLMSLWKIGAIPIIVSNKISFAELIDYIKEVNCDFILTDVPMVFSLADKVISLQESFFGFVESNLIDKTFYLCNSLAYLTNGSLNKMINYVDMRFNEISVFGINDSLFALKENQI